MNDEPERLTLKTVLTPPQRSSLRLELHGHLDNAVIGDLRGELYSLGLDHDDVVAVMRAANDLVNGLTAIRQDPFDVAQLNRVALAHRDLDRQLSRLFVDFLL